MVFLSSVSTALRQPAAALTVLCALCGPVAAQEVLVVTRLDDGGPGSLRAALDRAATSETPVSISLQAQGVIEILSPLRYHGAAPLAIFGQGQSIVAAGNFTLLEITQGADLYVRRLGFEGPGGFDIDNRGDLDGPAGKGIFVDLRDDQTGTVTLELDSVTLRNVAGHGVHLSDCALADACGGGSGGAGEGSDASILVRLSAVSIEDTGLGSFDADGLRVDERGPGDIHLYLNASRFAGVGGDGVELDEAQDGKVVLRVVGSSFESNGAYCDPIRLAGFLPEVTEAEFAKGKRTIAEIPAPVTGSPDDRCLEREVDLHGDGSVEEYAFSIDVDDGLDVDEEGPGGIDALLEQTAIIGNLDQGLDLDEEDAGSIALTLIGVIGSDNRDDAFKVSEEDSGDVIVALVDLRADGNGGTGMVFEEEDSGDLHVTGQGLYSAYNDGGIEVTQDDGGAGTLTLSLSRIEDGISAEGVFVR